MHNVRDFGALGDGSNATAAFLAAAALGGCTYVPAGVYILSDAVRLKSGARWVGEGRSTKVVAAANIAQVPYPGGLARFLFTNEDYSLGNEDISLSRMDLDFQAPTPYGGTHCVHFRNVKHIEINRLTTRYGGDGVALTLATDFHVSRMSCRDHSNAALDCWEACERGAFTDFDLVDCEMGVLVTGIGGEPLTTRRITVSRGSITNAGSHGVWFQGNHVDGVPGWVKDSSVSDVHVAGAAIFGIRASEADGIVISGNTVSGAQQYGIGIVGEIQSAGMNGVIASNVVRDCVNPIYLGNTADGWSIDSNVLIGSDRRIIVGPGAVNNIVGCSNGAVFVNQGGPSNRMCRKAFQ